MGLEYFPLQELGHSSWGSCSQVAHLEASRDWTYALTASAVDVVCPGMRPYARLLLIPAMLVGLAARSWKTAAAPSWSFTMSPLMLSHLGELFAANAHELAQVDPDACFLGIRNEVLFPNYRFQVPGAFLCEAVSFSLNGLPGLWVSHHLGSAE